MSTSLLPEAMMKSQSLLPLRTMCEFMAMHQHGSVSVSTAHINTKGHAHFPGLGFCPEPRTVESWPHSSHCSTQEGRPTLCKGIPVELALVFQGPR